MEERWIVGNIRHGNHHSSFFLITHTKKKKEDDKREQEILINNSGIRAINRQYWIFRTLEGWSQLRWRRTGSQPSSNGISQCSVLCVDWAALHHGAGRFSWLHAAVHLLCLQDHPSENLHGRLGDRERETHTRKHPGRCHMFQSRHFECSSSTHSQPAKPHRGDAVVLLTRFEADRLTS